jgi:hypothetical protein
MPIDLKEQILSMTDSFQFRAGLPPIETTVLRYMLGTFGPFEKTFPRNVDAATMQREFDERRRTLQPFV